MLFSEISIPKAVFNEYMVKASAEDKKRLKEIGIKIIDVKYFGSNDTADQPGKGRI
jgi:hypothetical protein